MASTFDINHLFNVNGLVAVVTGGGSGKGPLRASDLHALAHARQELVS